MSTPGSPDADVPTLVGRTFEVTALDGAPVLDGRRPELTFDVAGRLTGQASINRVFGPFELADGILRIGPMGSTMMAGPPAAMAQEHRLLQILGGRLSVAAGADADEVLLSGDSGAVVLRETEGEQL